jgi:hypothetical protein
LKGICSCVGGQGGVNELKGTSSWGEKGKVGWARGSGDAGLRCSLKTGCPTCVEQESEKKRQSSCDLTRMAVQLM